MKPFGTSDKFLCRQMETLMKWEQIPTSLCFKSREAPSRWTGVFWHFQLFSQFSTSWVGGKEPGNKLNVKVHTEGFILQFHLVWTQIFSQHHHHLESINRSQKRPQQLAALSLVNSSGFLLWFDYLLVWRFIHRNTEYYDPEANKKVKSRLWAFDDTVPVHGYIFPPCVFTETLGIKKKASFCLPQSAPKHIT